MLGIPVDHSGHMLGVAAPALAIADRTVRPPMNENPDLAVIKPCRNRHCLQRFPAAVVRRSFDFCRMQRTDDHRKRYNNLIFHESVPMLPLFWPPSSEAPLLRHAVAHARQHFDWHRDRQHHRHERASLDTAHPTIDRKLQTLC